MLSYEGKFRLAVGLWVAAIIACCFAPYGWVAAMLWLVVGLLYSTQLTWWAPRVRATLPTFLMLHSVSDTIIDETCANNSLRPAELDRLIVDLKAAGYTFQTATEACKTPCRRSMCLTFDDGYVDNYTELFPILKRHQVKATCFITSRGETDPAFLSIAQVREMAASGLVEFGGHTACHTVLGACSREETEDAITSNIEWLTKVLGEKPQAFAYPCGEYTEHTLAVLTALGIPYAYTMHKKMRPVAEAPLFIHRQIIPRGKTPLQAYLLATRGKYKL